MTWKCLREQIEALTPEQQESDVSVYVRDSDETWAVKGIAEVGNFTTLHDDNLIDNPCGGVLDDGEMFLFTE